MEEKAQYKRSEFELGPCNIESLQTAFNAEQKVVEALVA